MTRRVIFKYPLRQQGEFPLDLPEGCRILGARNQRNRPVLYAMVDPKAPLVRRKFRVVNTGEKFLDDPVVLAGKNERGEPSTYATNGMCYVDTFVLYKGDYVGHLFEVFDG